ncbi:hypothetical protein EG329_005105 [Mollisiaceae sp. DMI_Dod_QoI]|nr:hypothetical protein EG329_005105 [Helotiales sp. DMI_Dod_QoI]
MEKFFVPLTRDNSIQLSCTMVTSLGRSLPRETLIVYVTGIDNPGAIWFPTVHALLDLDTSENLPPMLIYDRVGQGNSIGKNADVPGRPKRHGRDCLEAAHDIRDVVTQIGQRLGIRPKDIDDLRIFFVASSIGAAICRLYAGSYPKTVSALIIIDSTLANFDTVSIFPDSQAPGFEERSLPSGITSQLCQDARRIIGAHYKSTSPNKEGLWRGNLPALLPHSDEPKIVGPSVRTPYITVIEHDRQKFVSDYWKLAKLPEIMTQVYFEPQWHEYHKGLARLTKQHLSKGPISKKGTGHLVHKDNPQFVAEEIIEHVRESQVAQPDAHGPSRETFNRTQSDNASPPAVVVIVFDWDEHAATLSTTPPSKVNVRATEFECVKHSIISFAAYMHFQATKSLISQEVCVQHIGVALKQLQKDIVMFGPQNSDAVVTASIFLAGTAQDWDQWAVFVDGYSKALTQIILSKHQTIYPDFCGSSLQLRRFSLRANPATTPLPIDKPIMRSHVHLVLDCILGASRIFGLQKWRQTGFEDLEKLTKSVDAALAAESDAATYHQLAWLRSWLFWMDLRKSNIGDDQMLLGALFYALVLTATATHHEALNFARYNFPNREDYLIDVWQDSPAKSLGEKPLINALREHGGSGILLQLLNPIKSIEDPRRFVFRPLVGLWSLKTQEIKGAWKRFHITEARASTTHFARIMAKAAQVLNKQKPVEFIIHAKNPNNMDEIVRRNPHLHCDAILAAMPAASSVVLGPRMRCDKSGKATVSWVVGPPLNEHSPKEVQELHHLEADFYNNCRRVLIDLKRKNSLPLQGKSSHDSSRKKRGEKKRGQERQTEARPVGWQSTTSRDLDSASGTDQFVEDKPLGPIRGQGDENKGYFRMSRLNARHTGKEPQNKKKGPLSEVKIRFKGTDDPNYRSLW